MQYKHQKRESQVTHKAHKIENNKITLDNSLDSDDYGLIVSKNGELKGIWIPDTVEDKENFPKAIANLCINYFGLDPNADEEYPATLH
jgi:hypothetical protein|tara:strand:+ start:873 stop:1136 length:264 start_codon:yes stop_codon:yes gene_type:complete